MSILAPSARLVGSRISRKEDPRLLTGRGRYVDDIVVPGMLHVAFARSDLARGRIVDIDVEAARGATGVVAVLTAADVNHLLVGPMGATPMLSMGAAGPYKVLADDEVRYVGDPYALVVADSRALAEDALELIALDVEPLPPVVDYTTALESAESVHPDRDGNVAGSMPMPPDDELRRIFETAPHVVTETFVQNRYLPVPMETRGIVAWWNPGLGSFDVWVSTQSPHDVRTVTSRITGVPESRIRVQMGDVGGGFGQKAYLARDEQIVLLSSYHLGKPLKWIEDRYENFVAASTARGALHGHDRGRRRRHHPRHCRRPPRRSWRLSASRECRSHGRGHLHRSLPNPQARVRVALRVHQHLLARAIPRAVAVRDLLPRTGNRQPRPKARHRPTRAPTSQRAAPR